MKDKTFEQEIKSIIDQYGILDAGDPFGEYNTPKSNNSKTPKLRLIEEILDAINHRSQDIISDLNEVIEYHEKTTERGFDPVYISKLREVTRKINNEK